MEYFYIICFFTFGIVFGSFFNVIGLRTPKNEPFIHERSHCPSCKHQLSWYELIPLLSFIIQGGKCRHCKKRISLIYPAIELLTGVLFAISYMKIGFNLELVTALFLISMLMIILVSDITYMLIQNKVLLFFLPIFIVIRVFNPLTPWWSSIVGAAVGFGIIALIIIVSRGGMGAGDMKLFGVLGIILGTKYVLLAFFLSCLAGAVIGMLLLVTKIINRKQPVPFGPYIVFATLITYFYGDSLIDWYLSLMS
ncbi:prepilin peptidase [Oceanobacillus piezotolerans]|uniref:Prepilin peptidase n=1 Tax=Oceanobacillus piezotolerans TaxID=2448030 RepID=A0A498DLE3_9BACI|nr:A24 family peptidase [Oceanobacillus piezotolerans]RLL47860.1 prepilin peptidase [Oceanobacillus piezotolerans]